MPSYRDGWTKATPSYMQERGRISVPLFASSLRVVCEKFVRTPVLLAKLTS